VNVNGLQSIAILIYRCATPYIYLGLLIGRMADVEHT